MKKLLLIGMMLSLLVSCQEEGTLLIDSTEDLQFEHDKELIASIGFDVSDLADEGDFYLVEGDIAIDKKGLKYNSTMATRHQILRGNTIKVPTDGTKKTIGIIYEVADTTWRRAFNDAVAEWSKINDWALELKWNDFYSNGGLIHIFQDNVLTLGAAYMPVNGNPGAAVSFNPNYGGTTFTFLHKKQAAVHLIGHALGFYHTDYKPAYVDLIYNDVSNGGYTVDTIEGTTTDSQSVMNTKALASSFSQISEGDKKAAKLLYPSVALVPDIPEEFQFVISKPTGIIASGIPKKFSVYSNDSNYTISDYRWEVDDATLDYTDQNTCNITFNSGGVKNIKVTATISRNGHKSARRTQTIKIDVYQQWHELKFNEYIVSNKKYEFSIVYPNLSGVSYEWNIPVGVYSENGSSPNTKKLAFPSYGDYTIKTRVVTQGISADWISSKITVKSHLPVCTNFPCDCFPFEFKLTNNHESSHDYSFCIWKIKNGGVPDYSHGQIVAEYFVVNKYESNVVRMHLPPGNPYRIGIYVDGDSFYKEYDWLMYNGGGIYTKYYEGWNIMEGSWCRFENLEFFPRSNIF